MSGAVSGVKSSRQARCPMCCHREWKVWNAAEFGESTVRLVTPSLLRDLGRMQCSRGSCSLAACPQRKAHSQRHLLWLRHLPGRAVTFLNMTVILFFWAYVPRTGNDWKQEENWPLPTTTGRRLHRNQLQPQYPRPSSPGATQQPPLPFLIQSNPIKAQSPTTPQCWCLSLPPPPSPLLESE